MRKSAIINWVDALTDRIDFLEKDIEVLEKKIAALEVQAQEQPKESRITELSSSDIYTANTHADQISVIIFKDKATITWEQEKHPKNVMP